MSMVEHRHDGTVGVRPVTPTGGYDVRAVLRWASQFSLLAAILVAWEILSSLVISRWDPTFALLFPTPSHVVRTMGRLMASGDLFIHWYTVHQNISFGLEMKGLARQERERLVSYYIDLVGLNGFERKYPRELSGGMKQRVGIARSLVPDPRIVLMDEPFASLDYQNRILMQDELLRVWGRETKAVVIVTHNIEEAIKLSDRVLVLTRQPGRVREVVSVGLPRPRDEADPEFVRLKLQITRELQQELAQEQRGSVS